MLLSHRDAFLEVKKCFAFLQKVFPQQYFSLICPAARQSPGLSDDDEFESVSQVSGPVSKYK